MKKSHALSLATILLLFPLTLPLLAQVKIGQKQAPATPPVRARQVPPVRARRRNVQAPCWRQVGIPESAMRQQRAIQENTRAEVQSVCADSSLTPRQKREKIRQIRQQAHQQLEGLITPQQREELNACRSQRGGGRSLGGGPRGGHGMEGPCGELREGRDAKPLPQEEEPEE